MTPLVLIGLLAIGFVAAIDPWNQHNFPPPPKVGELGSLDHGIVDKTVDFDDTSGFLEAGYPCNTSLPCVDPLQCQQMDLPAPDKTNSLTGICASITCSDNCANQPTLDCPSDSYSYTSFINNSESRRCCIQTCLCLPDGCNQSSPQSCQYTYDYISRGKGIPGNCCDAKVCFDDATEKHSFECVYNGRRYKHGDSWHNDQCEHCQCKFGVNRCNWTDNCPLPNKCNNTEQPVTLSQDQCCPPCKKCLYNNTYYKHEQEWQDTSAKCQTCICRNSKVNCITALCKPPQCTVNQKRVHRADDCCDTCVCALHCPHGYQTDANGVEVCECAHDPTVASSKTCQDARCDSTDKATVKIGVGVAGLFVLLALVGVSCYIYNLWKKKKSIKGEYKTVNNEDLTSMPSSSPKETSSTENNKSTSRV